MRQTLAWRITAPGCAAAENSKEGKRRARSMRKRLVILGGGHGRAVADAALKMDCRTLAFPDDRTTGRCIGFPARRREKGAAV